MTAATADKPKLYPLRKRTGTASFHLSTEAVDFGLEDLEKLKPLQAIQFVATSLWGSFKEMPCPHCGTFDTHYWSIKELRWKCKGCGKRFSVTSNTVLSGRKLPLTKILKIAFSWNSGAAGKAALQLRREWNVAYQTVFTLAHKLREGILRGYNVGILCGTHEMDGMDVNGRRHHEKRNKPLGGRNPTKPALPLYLLKPEEGELAGPPLPPKFEKNRKQNPYRRNALVVRQQGLEKGRGGDTTRISISRSESTVTVTLMAKQYASAESTIVTDEDPSYAAFGRLFAKHRTVNHSKEYSTPEGVSNNQAESFNLRMKRAITGVYLNVSNKYLADYGAEGGWREDTRKLSTSEKLKHVVRMALWVGMSMFWRGYTQGKHREYELLIEGPEPAKARGRPKGWKAKPPR